MDTQLQQPDLDPAIAEALDRVDRRADLVGERFTATAGEGEAAEMTRSGVLLDRFVADVEEALRQVFTAGLSFPDPELGDELSWLAERAGRHGLPSALTLLGRLEVWVRAIGAETDAGRRSHLASEAWDQTQRLVSWLRLLRTELDFLTVEGKLAEDAGQQQEGAEVSFPTRTLTAWPVGMELEPGGKLLIFCQDVDSGQPVVLRDHLSEFDANAPMADPVISRLFQDAVELGAVMNGLIRLEDHPVVQRRHSLLFRPAFRAIPRALAVTHGFSPPPLPELDPLRKGVLTPVQTRATVSMARDGRVRWRAPVQIHGSEVLRFNGTKALAREGADRVELDVVVRPRGETLRVLSAETEDGRVFLADDPTLFRLAPSALARVAQRTSADLADEPGAGCWLRTAAYLFGGADDEAVDRLREDLTRCGGEDLEAQYLVGQCRFVLGEPLPADAVQQLVQDTLELAALPKGVAAPLDALERVLGRQVSPTDLRHVTDGMVYRALWLAHEAELTQQLEDPLRRLVTARYTGKLRSALPEAVCARALAVHMVEVLDGDVDDDEDGGGGEALTFLEAHLDDLLPGHGRGTGRRRRQPPPMPELVELFQLGDTFALLTGGDRHGVTHAELGLPWLALAQTCADALLGWRVEPPDDHNAVVAGDALLAVAAANLKRFFVY